MNGFNLPELIVESIIRDGLINCKENPAIIDNVFAQLTRSYNSRKYGQTELNKIKNLLKKDIAVVYSYFEVDEKTPCFSIMIGADDEDAKRDHLGDDYGTVEEEIVDPAKLEALHRVEGVVISSYNAQSGQAKVDDSVDLSEIYKGMVYEDEEGREFFIVGGISNEPGNKFFTLDKALDELGTTGLIKSSLDYEVTEVRGITSDVSLVIGVHSKDALTTKYLYILLKYFLLSRKKDMIKRGLYLPTMHGSDFNRDQQFVGDKIYTRFLTMKGKVDDTWRTDQVVLIDNIIVEGKPVE